MKKIIRVFLAVLMVISVSNLFSQTKSYFAKKNTWEAGGSFSLTSVKYVSNSNTGDAFTTLDIMPYGGYFITDGFELGLIPEIEYMTISNSNSTNFTFYVAPSYNFYTESPAYPYLQGAVGYNSQTGSGMTSRSGLAWKLEGGMKLNLLGNSLLKLGLGYEQKNIESSNSTGSRSGTNTISFVAGFGVFFK
jgi:hypothetical protein